MPQGFRWSRFVLLAIAVTGLLAGCSKRQLGLPRVALEQASPDGSVVAYVRNHMEIDPPSQSLWIRSAAGRKKVLRLGADSDWCNTIVWSGDGSRVGFLVQDARLVVADAATAEIVWQGWLVGEEPRSYPTREQVFELALSDDGLQASFERCPRRGEGDCDLVEQITLR